MIFLIFIRYKTTHLRIFLVSLSDVQDYLCKVVMFVIKAEVYLCMSFAILHFKSIWQALR
ncbi:hypothetical protein AO066_02010 [Pseudomonas fluorescens]|nr:hypothetical protein AO066_02010 [Pseudomonas fluorescens]